MIQQKSSTPLKWVPSLYFAMGLPFVVLNAVMAVLYKDMGISDAKITFWTSLIMWPWTIKFLWSPFLEIFRTKKFFVVLTQLLSGVLFAVAAFALQLPMFFAITVGLSALIAFSGATHDIAADGVYMAELSTGEQAKYIGWQGAFYNLAKLVATGGLIWLAGYLFNRFAEQSLLPATSIYAHAWAIVLAIISLLMLLSGLWHLYALPQGGSSAAKGASAKDAWRSLRAVIASFFTKRHVWLYIAFIILYRLGEGFVMKIVPLFLKADVTSGGLGLTNQQFGLYYGTFGAAAFLTGSLLAGYYIAHRGLRQALFSLVCVFNLPFVVYAFLAWFSPQSMWLVCGGIVIEYFGYGFGFVGLTLFMMQQVAPGPYRMAHYAFASGIMNFSVMVTGMVSGLLSDAMGYKFFFIAVLLTTIPIFVLSRRIPFTHTDEE
jgi:PAT family beta-lactamase induction signal transducer AmpG